MRKITTHLPTRLIIGIAAVIPFALAPQLAQAEVPGSLAQLASPSNCIESPAVESSDCQSTAPGLLGSSGLAITPNGQYVYVIGNGDYAIAEFSRNAADDSLLPIGCIAAASQTDDNGCTDNATAVGLVRPRAIAVSPDGKNVYVTAQDTQGNGTVAEFSIGGDGTLTQLGDGNECIAENSETSDCTGNNSADGLKVPTGIAVSPDGKDVYVADETGSAITTLARASDGSLGQPDGSSDCITETGDGNSDCATPATAAKGLTDVDAVVVSPDGNNVYAGSSDNPGAIAEFARGEDGTLTQLTGENNCIGQEADSSECGTQTGQGINFVASLAFSPDGNNLYAAAGGANGTLAEFVRNSDGSLSQLGNGSDCIGEHGDETGCDGSGNGLNGASTVAVSPDGASVYVSTQGDDCCGETVAEFARSSVDGSLNQLASPDNCIEEVADEGSECGNENGTGIGGGGLVISPDGASTYVTGQDAIAAFARNPTQHTLTVTLSGSGGGGVSDGTGDIACPTDCSHAYPVATQVTLTATPASGSTFTGWTGGCSGTGTCQVTMSADTAVTATFTSVAPPTPGSPTPVLTGAPSAVTDGGAGFSGSANPEGLPTTAYFQYGLDQRYSQVGASGPNYTAQTPAQTVGSDFASHGVGPVTVTGLVPNALYHVRLVATNSAGTTFGQDVTFTTSHGPTPGAPTLGNTFNIAPVSGVVLVYINGHLVPLTELTQIGPNVVVDTLHGTLQLTTAGGGGGGGAHDAAAKGKKTQTGQFGGAVFRIHQTANGPNKGMATLMMVESAFKGAPGQAICENNAAGDAHAAKVSSKVIQLLHASAHGQFSTSGRYSAATVRGTKWTITARCDGTLVHDITDSVAVTDFVRHRTIILHAGQSYFAPGPRKRK